MNRLRVVADDHGLHPDINRGIADAVDAGTVSGVSVCVTGRAADRAPLRRWQDAGIDIGLHVTLVGEPWTTGRRFTNWRAILPRLVAMGSGFRQAVARELAAQVARCREQGLRVKHLDSHQHLHVLPSLWPLFAEMAAREGIGRIRLPMAPSPSLARPGFAGRMLQFHASRRPRERAVPCIGLRHGGHNTLATLEQELRTASTPDLEFVTHPGISTDDIRRRYGDWGYDWTGEREMLVDPAFRDTVERCGYTLSPTPVNRPGRPNRRAAP